MRFQRTSTDRYVSADTAYRVYRQVLQTFTLGLLLFIATPVVAEEFSSGSAAELAVQTNLLKGPQEDSEIIGRLPKGTVLTVLEESKGGFVRVEVELIAGVEQGWVDEKSIKDSSLEVEENKNLNQKKNKRRKKKRRLPDDEMALLRREATFTYGVYLGGNYGVLAATDTASSLYQGIGGQGGGFWRYFIEPDMTLGAEVGVTQIQGATAINQDTNTSLVGSARLLDIAAVYEYLYEKFRFFGAIQYSLGMSLAEFPSDQTYTVSDIGGLWLKGGAGYSLVLNDVVSLVGKGFIGYAFNRNYIGFTTFGLSAYLEFKG
ncbi:MAG: SH3 domain-containing protein [Proteobacteria bacterium]|nr:SH3 domain-containing protein [Pseudomonadota bacterium]